MKKLITASLIAILSLVVNAASVNWKIYSDWVSSDGENPLEASVYAFDALAYSSETVASALAEGNKDVLGYALAFGSVNDEGAFGFSGTGITDDGASPASASAFVVLLANDDLGAEFFYATDTKILALTEAVLSGKANFYWDEITPSEVGGSGWTAVGAPEPTSGLLLLLGMAGLALRRKQK